jgi:hypothetical protein
VNNYPAGASCARDASAYCGKEFEGALALDGAKHTFLVLDGRNG